MTVGFSTEDCWKALPELRTANAAGEMDCHDPYFNDADFEGIWVVLDPRAAPHYLILSVGSRTEEYLHVIDITGATPVLRHEDGRVFYIRKKGGVNNVEPTNRKAVGQNTQTL